MKVQITDVVKTNGGTLEVEFNEELIGIDEVSNEQEIVLDKLVSFKGSVVNQSGLLRLVGKLKFDYSSRCYRCLKDIHNQVILDVDEGFVNERLKTEDDEYTYKTHYMLIDKALLDNIILGLPMKQVCGNDCRGLCIKCGINLNDDKCGCEYENETNPYMEVLKKLDIQ